MVSTRESLWRWVLPAAGLVVGGVGGGVAAVTSNSSPPVALAGGAAAGVAGLVAGLALSTARDRRSMALARRQATLRRAAAGEVLPLSGTPPREAAGPSWLLSPDSQVAKFRGRGRELAALREWSADAGAPPVLVMVGRAGVGKTRLIVEFARRHAGGWTVLRVRNGKESGLMDTLLACDVPTLVIVELKHPRPGLVDLLEDLRRSVGRVKVLVECRSEA